MKERILIMEDETAIQSVLYELLTDAGYEVSLASDGLEGISLFQSQSFSLILLDIMMPKIDGYAVCEFIRKKSRIPIIMLTAMDEEEAQIRAFELQVDDYITKPFGMMELVSRVKAVLRRSSRNEKKDEIVVGQLKIYPNKHKVKSCGNEVTLTNKEFKLLCLLVESKGNVLNRDQLLTNIWGYDFDGETRTVDVHIRSLRQKLGECGKLIETVRGIGYRIGGNES